MKHLLILITALILIVSPVAALLPGGGGIYSNNVSFYVITPPAGIQTNYPVMITLTNQSGISGLYGVLDNTRPNIIIYTNGTTRPDWYDINFTNSDGSSSVPFWIENGTTNATSSSAWILTTTNTTYAVYYGNSSQSSASLGNNIYNTFPYGEDYSVNTLNTTQTVVTAVSGGSYAISNGVAVITGGTSAREQLRSLSRFGSGYSVRSRFKTSSDGTAAFAVGFGEPAFEADTAGITGVTSAKYYQTLKSSTATSIDRTSTLTSYVVGETSRYGTSTVNFSENNAYITKSTTNIPIASINISTARYGTSYTVSVDWIVVRPSVYPEPSASSFASYGPVTLTSAFNTNTTIANTPVTVQFTDTSSGFPEQWNWSFGDGTYSTLQNPSHTYSTHDVYNVSLLASTSTENKTSANTTLYFQRSAVTIGDSIARGLGFGRVYSIYTGVGWNESYRPSDDATAYESEMQFNHTPFEQWDWRYNMGWGGDTTTGVKNRWLRDAIGQEVYLADTLPNYTIDNKTPSVILLNVGINDITSSVAASTIENNIWYCVNDANSRGIPVIVISIFPKATNTAAIQAVNTWEEAMFNGNASMPNVRWVDAYTFLDDGSGNIKAPYNNGDNVHISPTGYIDLTSKIYTENSDLFDVNVIIADFTQSPNPSTVNQTVTLMDTSTDGPTTWNWTIDGSTTNTTQNAAYAFSTAGTHTIDLNVTNSTGSFSNITKTQTVVNASGFTQQDLWQTGHYTKTIHITDSATNAPIPVVVVTDSNGQSYTTTNGTAYFTEDAGAVVFYFAATGYVSKSMSYIIDGDSEDTVQMVAADTNQPVYNVYPPKDVKFHITSFFGTPLTGATVTIHGITTSTGNWDWLVTLLGISLDEVAINGTAMSETTDSNGDVVFLMLPSVKYNITTTASGYTFPTSFIAPQATEYTITANWNESWFSSGNDTLKDVNVSVSWVKFNDTHSFVNITYDDQTMTTTGGTITVYRDSTARVANASAISTMDITAPSCSNSTLVNTPTGGASYKVQVNATTTSGENVVRTFTHSFKGATVTLPGWTPETLLWLSLFIIIFTAAFAGALHAPQMSVILCVEAWVFWSIGWMDYLISWNGYAEGALLIVLTVATFFTVIWSITEGKAKGKRSS